MSKQGFMVVGSILDHPLVKLIIAVILLAITLSGKFSVIATRILLLLAWAIGIFSLSRIAPPRKHLKKLILYSLVYTVALLLIALWARPEVAPQYAGIIRARRTILFSSVGTEGALFQIGPDGALFDYTGPAGQPVFTFLKGSRLVVERVGREILVSTQVRDKRGHLIAEIIQNEWKVSPPPYSWDRNYNDYALEIKAPDGKIVLQVEALQDRISIQGEWWDASGHGIRLAQCPIDGRFGSCIRGLSVENDPDEPSIKPIFKYPSDRHFGATIEPSKKKMYQNLNPPYKVPRTLPLRVE